MFDIGFTEILLIGIVSLVVLGPEKLPGAVRTAALMIGRLKRSFNTLKTEIEKEIGADEIRRQLRNEEIMDKFKQTQSVLSDTMNSVREGAEEFRKNVELESESAGWSSHGGGPAETSAGASLADAAQVDSVTSSSTETVAPVSTEMVAPPTSTAATTESPASAASTATAADADIATTKSAS